MLAKLSTMQISEVGNSETMDEHSQMAKQGGEITRNARMELEVKTGQKVVSPLNAKKGILKSGKKDIE
jgi:hypothetical protein